MKLTEKQLDCLHWLYARNSSGYIDRYGRVCAEGEYRNQGSSTAWLHLVAKGMVCGGGDRIELTPLAMDYLAADGVNAKCPF